MGDTRRGRHGHPRAPRGVAVDRDRAVRVIERVRWGAVGFVVVQFALFEPSARAAEVPLPPLVGGVLFASVLAGVNLLSLGLRSGRPTPRRLRAGGAVVTVADIAVVIALISYFSFDPDVRLWPMLVFPILEGAVLGGLGGAVGTWALASVGYGVEQLVDGPGQGYTTPELVPAITFASAVLATVAVTTGVLARAVAEAQATSAAHEARLAELVRIGRELAAENRPEVLLERFVAAACALTGLDRALLLDEEDDTVRAPFPVDTPSAWAVRTVAPGTTAPSMAMQDGHRLATLAASLHGTEVITDVRDQPVVADLLPGCRTLAVAPVRSEGDVLALLLLGSTEAQTVSEEQASALELLAGHAAVALENAELARARERTIEELEEVDRLKSDFVSILTHELRSPMTAVAGFADILEARWETLSDEQRRRFVDRISTGVRRQSRLVGDVADALLAERTELPVEDQAVDVPAIVHDAVASNHLVTGEERITVEVAPGTPTGRCDAARLRQVVDNLLSNALKYSPLGSPVEVLVAPGPGRGVLVAVADRGLGIPAERRHRLFQKFSRLHPDHGVGGTGLGLYLCAQLVAAMGGRIDVDDRPGGGTTFTVHLRASKEPLDAVDDVSIHLDVVPPSRRPQVDHVP